GTIGGSLSHADPAAETPAVMLGYRARLVLANVKGERTVDASDFTAGTFETCLAEGEILKEIIVTVPSSEGTAFVELSRRKGDFAMASAAARLSLDENGNCRSAHLVIGAVAPVPLRCDAAASALVGHPVTHETVEEALALI